jgi:uncharacterized 2Fe-2S/4Fe-4S cluster protein (DUF4445 family)
MRVMRHVLFTPEGLRVPCAEGATVMEAARRAGVSLTSTCGGQTTCGRCKVRVLSGSVPAPGAGERARLRDDEVAGGIRLACAARVFDDLEVAVPPGSRIEEGPVRLSGEGIELAPDPVIAVHDLPGVHDLAELHCDAAALQDLRSARQNGKAPEAILVRDGEIVGVQRYRREPLGMAFDLGTTTIAAYLLGLESGRSLASRGTTNPQVAWGGDVISRIRHAMENGGDELKNCVRDVLNRLIEEAVADPEEVAEVTIAGNTAMHHLALGLPVRQLGTAPYQPSVRDALDLKARDLGLRTARGAYVHFLPNIDGFVGGDHVAMLLATGMWETDRTVVGIDIGTNTEVTLAASGILRSLSCASGPAFEGAGITHGMRAASGAIERVHIDDKGIRLKVVGNVRPAGICGSGILDLLSELCRCGIIGPRGGLRKHPLVRQGPDGPEFVVAPGGGTGRDVVVTQRDVGRIQLAKAAIAAGIRILLGEAGLAEDAIEEVIIAGAFGQSLDPGSAVDIGMFPPVRSECFRQVGNAAGMGAKLALASRRGRAIAGEIARRVRYVELTTHPRFTREFSHALPFGEWGQSHECNN